MARHSIQNSNTFLAYYNQIDKFLGEVLELTRYMPYIEKIEMVARGKYSMSHFVRLYQNKLNYFGDLRNQLVHGFRLEKQHYILVSDFAVEEIQTVCEELHKPSPVADIFNREVYTCTLQDPLREVITSMRQDLNTHVPVYDDAGRFVEMISESTIAYRLADEIGDDGEAHMAEVLVKDVPLENTNDEFRFVDKTMSIYAIEEMFATTLAKKKRLGAVFITSTGDEQEPILGIITAMDIPKLADHFMDI